MYIEHAVLEQENHSVSIRREDGETALPAASVSLLLLGPGCTITHNAVKTLAANGCTIAWCGDECSRFYAFGMGENRDSDCLLRQAKAFFMPELRDRVIKRLYARRFSEGIEKDVSIETVRGMEGARVRAAYQQAAKQYGVEWNGRQLGVDWDTMDTVNQALSLANAHLYAICQSAILSLGYSSGIGFIHRGDCRSFVFDIADMYKLETTVPAAFQVAAANPEKLESAVRETCREVFHRFKLRNHLPTDLEWLFADVEVSVEQSFAQQDWL